ncbi:MAG: bifunctional ADP-heptose synthase [Bacteroidales bacterium]|nr:bifunctional ADP-heptose synthase [Bacteroidales bacterium]
MHNYKDIIKKFREKTILVIGDVMLDQYIWGKVERISPEAPIPIVSVTHREERLGGAANVALNIKTLGAKPIIACVIGNDIKAKRFIELCKEQEILTNGIIESTFRPTTVKTRVIGHNQHLLRVDEENDKPLQNNEEVLLLNKILEIIEQFKIDAIIFEDYDKGCITPNLIQFVQTLAKTRQIPITVDPKHRNFMQYYECTLFKPNLKELTIGLKTDIEKEKILDQLPTLCTEFMKLKRHHTIMVTLSELGVYIANHQESFHIPTQVRNLADVSGAGDTVISTATLCLTLGLNIKDIAIISNIAAGIVCEKVGVVPIFKDELEQRLS